MSAGWESDAPSPDQLKEFFAQVGDGRIRADRLQRFLTAKVFPTWTTIHLGTWKDVRTAFRAMQRARVRVDGYAREMIENWKFTLTAQLERIELVKVRTFDLDCPACATFRQIYEAALRCQLILCSADVGPQLRVQYRESAPGIDPLRVAMSSLPDARSEHFRIFSVERPDDSGYWLKGVQCDEDYVWPADTRWVFRRWSPST